MTSLTQKLLNQANQQKQQKKVKPINEDEEYGEEIADCSCCCLCCGVQFLFTKILKNKKQLLRSFADYFQVNDADVKDRMKCALFLDNRFHIVAREQPDLYGPFWIQTTLIFILIVGTVLSEYFLKQQMIRENKSVIDIEKMQKQFAFLPKAIYLVYGFGIAQPIIIFIFVRFHGIQVQLSSLICTYGYSYTPFLLVTLACFAPSNTVQLVALGYGALSSFLFLFRNYTIDSWSEGQRINSGSLMILKLVVMGIQGLLVFLYKFYFFEAISL